MKGQWKKVLALSMALILTLFSFADFKAFAYSGGLLNGKAFTLTNDTSISSNNGSTKLLTDGDTDTRFSLASNGGLPIGAYYHFSSPVDLTSFYTRVISVGNLYITLYDSNKKLLYISTLSAVMNGVYSLPSTISNVSYVQLYNQHPTMSSSLTEFDVFGTVSAPDTTPPYNVSDLAANNITYNGFNLSWNAPTDPDLSGYKVYLNNALIQTTSSTAYSFTNLAPSTQYNVKITAYDKTGNENTGTTMTVKTNDPPDTSPPSNVTNLTATPTYNSVSLSWTNPPDADFAKVKIYEDGVYQKSVTAADGATATFNNLNPEATYTFKVTSVDYTGNESTGSSIQVTTLPLPKVKDITNLSADTKYDRVKLSWDLPNSPDFHHVSISRKEVQKESFLQSLFSLGTTKVYAAGTTDDYKPMFETNGTYWTDLTVSPDTNYEYKLSSVNTDGRTSEGVTIEASTPQEPKPEIKGASFQSSDNGDYIVSWQQPTTGTMKILVGGNEYKTVSADQGSYTIPKSDMKYTKIGDPDVSLQPVSEFGTVGDKVSAPSENLKIPFTTKDLVDSGNGLLLLLAPFILLALSFLLVPKFRKIIVSAFRGKDRTDPEFPNGRRSKDKEPSGIEQRKKTERIEKEQKDPKPPKIRVEKEQRTERMSRQPREQREPQFKLKRQSRTSRTERETRQPREPRERKRG